MRRRFGYTIVEVSLVIAITALIFIAFLSSVGSSLSSKRYSDSVLNFTEFLRTQYSAVINVESGGTGTTNKAIYGRLITFGEKGDDIYSYDIIGDAISPDTMSASLGIVDALKKVNATIVTGAGTASCSAINESVYSISNGAYLETTAATHTRFTGSLLIVRSPISGTVTTLFSKTTAAVQASCHNAGTVFTSMLSSAAASTKFDALPAGGLNFCVASDDHPDDAGARRNIRISRHAANSSAIIIVPQDQGDNQCQ